MTEPLAGLRVVDLSRVLTSPYAAMMPDGVATHVIKVERGVPPGLAALDER